MCVGVSVGVHCVCQECGRGRGTQALTPNPASSTLPSALPSVQEDETQARN